MVQFFIQQRSGWLGRPFTLLKLRTMTVQPEDAPAERTKVGDQRITVVGGFSVGCGWMNCPVAQCAEWGNGLIGPRQSGRSSNFNWSQHPSLPQAPLDASGPQWLGSGVCALCQQH